MGDNGLRTLHGTAWNEWRRYACLWQPSQCNWYLDDQLLFTQQYSAASAPTPNPQNNPVGAFSILDEETPGMALILGCGSNWVLEVDWVRVWAGV